MGPGGLAVGEAIEAGNSAHLIAFITRGHSNV
jgi:hypothetical protein